MKVICRGKATGKSTELIQMCAENGGYIVCESLHRADKIAKYARMLGLNIPLPITFREFITHQYSPQGIKNFYFDNIDRILQGMTSVEIKAISLTEDE